MPPRCSFCGAPAGTPCDADLHRAFDALKSESNASEPLSPARHILKDSAKFKKAADPWHDAKRRR